MSELWHWRSNNRVRGPLVTEELEAIVLSQRLQEGDAIRLDGTEEWLPAAEIRRMFAESAESPAKTAARLLESAATRRLKAGSVLQRRSLAIGRLGPWLFSQFTAVASWMLELAARCIHQCAAWFGRRGRLILTAVVATAAVGFLAWRFVPWGESDLARLQKLKTVWKQIQSQPATAVSTGGPEAARWLAQTEADLTAKLRAQPITVANGVERQRALARRETLFAVREIRKGANLHEESRQRVDESLESAMNYLVQMPAIRKQPISTDNGPSIIIVCILVADVIVVLGLASWWWSGRQRR